MICRGIRFFPLTLNEIYFLDSAHQPHFFLLKPSLCFEKGIEKSLFYSLYKLDILSNHPNHWPTGSPKQLNLLPWETYRTCERCLFKSSLTTCHWHGFYFLKYPTVPRPTSQENCLHNEGEFYCSYYLPLVQDDEKWVGVGDLERSSASTTFNNVKFVICSFLCHFLKGEALFIHLRKPSTQEVRCLSSVDVNVLLFPGMPCKHVTAVREHEVCLFSNGFHVGAGEKPLWRRQW